MVPAAAVDQSSAALVPFLDSEGAFVDSGNYYYRDDIRPSAELNAKGTNYMDVGISGGTWGSERRYCLMNRGQDDVDRRLNPAFAALAPSIARRYLT